MKNVPRALLLVCLVSLIAVSGCKQEGSAGSGTTNGEKKTGGDTGNGTDKKSGSSSSTGEKTESVKLVEVPKNIVDQIMKPFEDVTLTTAQQKQVDTLIQSNGAEFQTIRQERNKLLAVDGRRDKLVAAKKNSSKDTLEDAEKAALGADIYATYDRFRTEQSDLIIKIRKSVQGLLTKEQIKLLNAARKAKNG